MTFEENLQRIDDIVRQLESDKLPLDKALDLYKEGVGLTVDSKKMLENAKLTVKNMNGDNTDD
ncbi:exodeoxyribonuclease VII small subunit [Ruminococcus albus]|uniref:Exodeoxyribonuclease 7 small subunit n=1 Tax=Ruminococcus albus (strain ATCC 27210 / DSM 20455 / JCM 14654 / NCDO 2250 / 7) TaxID=697329 RepID=E6UAN7_RUMA7|nr:exodeoxyribonuclease VII small subunit [Ruminococcus albus]ADU22459.1 Exonuclease VII small subunit [Ruminococcus albus 7 = DSM 20455]